MASFSAAKKQDAVQSYCVWAPGVDALLPRTQLVMFPREDDKVTAAEWDRVAAAVGSLMVRDESYYPIRYRVREFPSEQQLAEIEAAGGN